MKLVDTGINLGKLFTEDVLTDSRKMARCNARCEAIA